MQILVVYNEPVLPASHPEAESEREVLDAMRSIAEYLDRPPTQVFQHGVGRDLEQFRQTLRDMRPEVVLNLFEGFGDNPSSECDVAWLLEDEGVAFTGCTSISLRRAGRKDIAKQVLARACLPTSPWLVVEELPADACGLNWPVIVKPAFRDASVGIHQASVVGQPAELNERITRTAHEYGLPVLVEEFIDGREISVALFDCADLTVLPFVEARFASHNGNWPIDSYAAKWDSSSRDHRARTLDYPAELEPNLAERVAAVSKAAYRALDCRGFVTIDLRIREGEPYILEVNPNADIKPSTCLTDLLQMSGIEYGDFLWQMIRGAMDRHKPEAVSKPAVSLSATKNLA
jgi:D-alanine-D-alanine ligase